MGLYILPASSLFEARSWHDVCSFGNELARIQLWPRYWHMSILEDMNIALFHWGVVNIQAFRELKGMTSPK